MNACSDDRMKDSCSIRHCPQILRREKMSCRVDVYMMGTALTPNR